jgi:anhydro-N-acetylmuramic acid kinase
MYFEMGRSGEWMASLTAQTYIKNGRILPEVQGIPWPFPGSGEKLSFSGKEKAAYFCTYMVYKVIGLMSGSSLDGLDIAYVHLQERTFTAQQSPKNWEFSLVHTACYPYPEVWKQKLASAPRLSALDYQLLHTEYGHYLGELVNRFVSEFHLSYQVQLIASHGHTAFHLPECKMTAQLGDGAALAAATRINVVSDLRAMDLALGGQGAPIVPVGEQRMFPGYGFYLNLGGIANISGYRLTEEGLAPGGVELKRETGVVESNRSAPLAFAGFDICPANRVLNDLAGLAGLDYDKGGSLAAGGRVRESLLKRLNALSYYGEAYPKSLANTFGTETVYPMILEAVRGESGDGKITVKGIGIADALRTYVEHISVQIRNAVAGLRERKLGGSKMLVTGGGAHNAFLIGSLRDSLAPMGVEIVVPAPELVDFKEALVMALIGVLRWREENNVLASVTGASRDSIGGAVWIGQEA